MLPQDFIDRMKAMMGDAYEEFEQSYEHVKYQSLRVNPLKAEKERAKRFLSALFSLCVFIASFAFV